MAFCCKRKTKEPSIKELKPFMVVYKGGNLDEDKITIDSSSSVEKFVTIFREFLSQNGNVQVIETTFVTHGFRADIEQNKIPEMKAAILNVPTDCSRGRIVVLVDWSIACTNYSNALDNIHHIAKWLADYIVALKDELGDKVYIYGIGHSLGAHLIGIAGRRGNQLWNSRKVFDRISGLDPAGPFNSQGLCKEDAIWVDVIHTSWLGTLDCIGSVDFFSNWGRVQSGVWWYGLPWTSHMRVLDLFLWSISNPGKFLTNQPFERSELTMFRTPTLLDTEKAIEYAEMGFHCKPETIGVWYIKTNDQEPWSVDL